FCILACFFSNGSLDDCGVMSLNQSVGDEFAKEGQERVCRVLGFNKLDTQRKMFFFRKSPSGRMRAMVRTKTRCGPDQRGPGDSALTEERKDLVVEEIVPGGCVFVEMNRYLLRQTRCEHSSPSRASRSRPPVQCFSIEGTCFT